MENIKEVINQIDILEVIQRYVPLKRSGQNYVGLCPFHTEKTPSFNVSSKRGTWKCFGCGKSGDVVNFIMEHEKKDFKEAMEILNLKTFPKSPKVDFKPLPPPKKLSVISPELIKASMRCYEHNNFVIGLHRLFDEKLVDKAIDTFNIGTSQRWKGATAFWYVDQATRTRQVKVMLYNSNNLKRIKKEQAPQIGKSKALFYGTTLLREKRIKEPSLSACWFGENQLSKNKAKPIAIVESEKTAILMTIFGWMNYPIARNHVWLATGGASAGQWNNFEALQVLEGKDVVLFPDLDAHDRWEELSWNLTGCNVKISHLLLKHKKPNEKDKRDIADFFLCTYKNDINLSKTIQSVPEQQTIMLNKLLSEHEKTLTKKVLSLMDELNLSESKAAIIFDDNLNLPKNIPESILSPTGDYYLKVNRDEVIFFACYDGTENYENGDMPKQYVSVTTAMIKGKNTT